MIKVLYSIFCIAGIFGGSIYLGGFMTLRQIMTIVMLIVCFLNYKMFKGTFTKYILYYLLFLFFWIISSTLEGSLDKCLRTLISQHFVSLVAYFSVILILKKYKSPNILLKTLLYTGIINSIANILQGIGNPIGMTLGAYFIDDNELLINQFEKLQSGYNGQYTFGLLGNAVANGAFSMILPFLPLYYMYENKGSKTFYGILLFLFLIALFYIQQRSCLLISLVCIIITLYRIGFFKGQKLIIILLFIIPLLLCFSQIFITSDVFTESRYMSENDRLREGIYEQGFNFILHHILFGGIETFRAKAIFSPHNIFLNAFIYAGLFGGFIIVYVYLSQLRYAYRLRHKASHIIIGWMFISEMLNALAHNTSIITGDFLTWTLWGLVFYINKDFVLQNEHR